LALADWRWIEVRGLNESGARELSQRVAALGIRFNVEAFEPKETRRA
jgi:hypothetical protein